MYNKAAQYVNNFNDFLVMFLNIVRQTSYKKCFIVKETTFDKVDLHINEMLWF